MKKYIFIFFYICFFGAISAQTNVIYDLDSNIKSVERQYIEAWKRVETLDGYRIQITAASGPNSKVHIENTKASFESKISDIPAYITYFEPYFRLRVGDFKTKLEAYHALQLIAPLFEGAYVVKDEIFYMNEIEDIENIEE